MLESAREDLGVAMDIDAYLARIGYSGSRETTRETLTQLHRAHLLAVPFENLDIHLGHPIGLSPASFYDKIVRRRRGGFCYELNGLFGWLLEQLGFAVVMLSARVYDGGRPGPEFDHLVLLVNAGESMIADVGFGDSFVEPLPLDTAATVVQQGSAYRLSRSGPDFVLERGRGAGWEPQYVFSLTPRRLSEFSAMCEHQQTSPESHFTHKAVCSRATPDGRITLSNTRLITTSAGRRVERNITDADDYRRHLMSDFGIELGEGQLVQKLLRRVGRPG